MEHHAILLADDMRTGSRKDLRRSRLLEKLAVELGRRLNGGVDILYVEDVESAEAPLRFQKAELVLSMKEEQSKYPVPVDFFVQSGTPAEAILSWKPEGKVPELVVLGTRGYRGLRKAFLGSVSEEVVRNSDRPVVVMGPEAQSRGFVLAPSKKMKILVMTDLEATSLPAELYALQFAKRTGSEVILCYSIGDRIHSLKTLYYSQGPTAYTPENTFEALELEAQGILQRKVEKYAEAGCKVSGRLITEDSPLERSLPKEAGRGYDLLIIGTRSRNKFLTAFLGSAARGAILRSPIPVMIVRSAEVGASS